MGCPCFSDGRAEFISLIAILVRPNRCLHFSVSLRTLDRLFRGAFLAVFLAAFGIFLLGSGLLVSRAGAQVTTKNAFVGASVTDGDGLVTIYNGDPLNRELLTYIEKSYLTLKVNGLYYSNNTNADYIGSNQYPPDVLLLNGGTGKVRDTIRTTWKEQGFDIEQDVYPVAFTSSGVIVVSIKIVNHSGTPLPAQAQFLLDNMNSDKDSANDNPWLLTRYGFIRDWQDMPPAPIPSFYLAFEHPPTEANLGVVGIAYMNDSFPPRPLGLIPPSFVEFGDWTTAQVYSTWGAAGLSRNTYTDCATLMMGPGGEIAEPPQNGDSVTELMRFAYGTPEWCYDHGNMFGFALYPHHLYWDPQSRTYSPNPFPVDAFLFTLGDNGSSHTTIRQTIGDPIRITNPKPSGLSKDTTEVTSISGIAPGSFYDFHWTDSAVVLPGGCAKSFPVDIQFNVSAGAIDTPIFFQPWECAIDVECPNPDTVAPRYKNSFLGCDSIQRDTVTVQDNYFYDLGLDSIGYASPDLPASAYRVTLAPAPPYPCIKTPVTILVQQVDTFQSGQIIFTLIDCAGNISHDTICFTAHPPLPDRTAPKFWLASPIDCHSQCRVLTVTDTNISDTSIDRGVDSIQVFSSTNMTPSGIPAGGTFPAGTQTVTLHACVTDSMHDGSIILRANDSTHNFSFDTITYCTTPDTTPPLLTHSAMDPATASWNVHGTDSQEWDRGLDSVWVVAASNVTITPSPIPNPIGCAPTFDLVVKVTDTTQCAQATIRAMDCAGNLSTVLQLSFSKGVKPVITASKNVLCSDTDFATLDAGGNFGGYEWSTGDTTRQITVRKAGIFTVTVQDGIGCAATSDPDTIVFSPAQPTIVPAGPIALCAPDSAKLDAGGGFATYQWLNNGTAIPGMTAETASITTSGSYTVQVTNSAGCSGTSAPVAVNIDPVPPKPVITSANNILSSTPAHTYQWFLNDTLIAGATGQTFTPQTGGSYTVMITDSSGCSSISDPFTNGGSTVVAVPAMVIAKESDHVTIPLSILSSQNLTPGMNRTFTTKLRFDKTLLVPLGSFVSEVAQGNDLVVEYTGSTAVTQGSIDILDFIAALGIDSCTTVTIDSFAWSTPGISVATQDGNFCLDSLCEQGGARLIDPNGQVSLTEAVPNPAYSSIEIDYHLIEHGQTTLTIYDVLGHEVMQLVNGDEEPGGYSAIADISSLPAGRYIYTLRTPTIVKSQNLQIAR